MKTNTKHRKRVGDPRSGPSWFIMFTLLIVGLAALPLLAMGVMILHSMGTAPGGGLATGLLLANAPAAVLTPEQVSEFKNLIEGIKGGWERMKLLPDQFKGLEALPGQVKTLVEDNTKLRTDLDALRKMNLNRRSASMTLRRPGFVTNECAEYLGACFVIGHNAKGRFDDLGGVVRDALVNRARNVLQIDTKAALTTTDIPLPIEYFSEVRELISEFGVVRNKMFPFPLGMGTAKPPRFKTRPAFGSIAMSATYPEKSPQIDFASLESHKIGGIVRTPREIDEQSIVPMGQFLARYGAIEFARAEDTWGFMADGSGTYESVKGVEKIARDNTKTVVLAATKTKPSDAVLADFRALRLKVNKAALSGKRSAYYLDSTWEAQLRTFNTEADPYIYIRNPDGSATFDGYPIVWTDVLQPYTTSAAADKTIAIFGALDYWWFAEKGSPRMDFSSDVYFATDELATRFTEEIDFDYQQADVTAALITAAS